MFTPYYQSKTVISGVDYPISLNNTERVLNTGYTLTLIINCLVEKTNARQLSGIPITLKTTNMKYPLLTIVGNRRFRKGC